MIERLSLDEWQAFDRAYPAPTFFARPAWALALQDAYAHMTAAPLQIRLRSGERIIVPLVRLSGGALRFKEYAGFPLGGYTMALRENGEAASTEQWDEVLRVLGRHADAVTIVPWPLAQVPHRNVSHSEHETGIVDLRDGVDAAFANVAGIFRRMAGQAERRGVACAPSTDEDAVEAYYALLEASAQRWGIGTPTYPKRLIEALHARGGNDVEIWFSTVDGQRIGGGVVFYGSSEFFFWSAAMDAEYGRLRPSNALNFALIRAAAQRGMSWYNLGSSEGLPGVARFKRDLGAADLRYAEFHTTRLPYTLYTQARQALAQRKRSTVPA
jgi:CelD/BcsL family acetyltransferase involved in cellulose biosynthesis